MKKVLFLIPLLLLLPILVIGQSSAFLDSKCVDYACNIDKVKSALANKNFKDAIDYCRAAKASPNADKINIIIVSDHGMASISKDKLINLSDHLNKDWFDVNRKRYEKFVKEPFNNFVQLLCIQVENTFITNSKVTVNTQEPGLT